MYRWMELKAQHQEADAFGASPASAGHLLSLAVGIEGCAVLASFPHPFSPLPFYLHFQALPLQVGLSDTVAGPFLAASPPLSVWSPSKGPRWIFSFCDCFLTSLIYLAKVPDVLSIFMYIFYVALIVCSKVGGKGIPGLEPEVDALRWQRGRAPPFLGSVSHFLETGYCTVCAHTFPGDWLATLFPLTVLTQRAWEKNIFHCSTGKWLHYSNAWTFIYKEHLVSVLKRCFVRGPEQGLQCMSLSNILPTAPTSSFCPVISCLLHLSVM